MAEAEIRWFFFDDAGNFRGPANLETLSILVNGGIITPATKMRREDATEWARADTFFDFADTVEDKPAPPPPEPKPEPPTPSAERPASVSPDHQPFYFKGEALPITEDGKVELGGLGFWDSLAASMKAAKENRKIAFHKDAKTAPVSPPTPPPPPPTSPSIPNVIDKGRPVSYGERLTMPEAEVRGLQGEEELLRRLERRLPLGGDSGYRIVRNLMFETPTGTTQLDFTIVSAFGIFIVEAKNYTGWIFGDPSRPRWTQSLPGGRKFQFQNPINQNFKHLAVLSDKTGIPQNLIFPLVAFADGCDFKTEMPANVMHFDEVAAYIQRFKSIIIKPEQLTEIMEALLSWDNAIDERKKRDHVQNLKDAHAPASIHDRNVLCPVCGNRMVLRRSKRDGNQFWGCSKYPGCRGIRQVAEEVEDRSHFGWG